jgi:ESS family glutamate:Na+ symporter
MLLALTLAFGQYLVGAIAVLFLLGPWLGVNPLMACLIEAAYEGGHGSAAAMGPHFARLGFAGGASLGLGLATVGLLASTMVGVVLVVVARWRGWLLSAKASDGESAAEDGPGAPGEARACAALAADPPHAPRTTEPHAGIPDPHAPASASQPSQTPKRPDQPVPSSHQVRLRSRQPLAPRPQKPLPEQPTPSLPSPELALSTWAVNLGLAGLAVALGWILLQLLRWGATRQGGGLSAILEAMPVFPLALAGSLLMRLALDRSGRGHWASARLQSRLGTIAADLLITAATASLDLTLLEQDWLPLTLLAALGLAWNVLVLLLLAPRVLPAGWFERGITEFGQATGVVASGILLLRMADPQDHSDALTAFSIKQMVLQPLLAGGMITVLAPMAVSSWGLERWTGVCLVLVLLWAGLGLALARSRPAA